MKRVPIKNLLLNNLLIKTVALFFAVALWVYVTSKGDLEVSFVLPLELRNIPTELIVVGEVTNVVNVRLKGRQSSIRGLDPGQVHVGVDLSDAKEGENYYSLNDDNIRLPMSVEVVRMNPRTVKVQVARLERRQVDVKTRTQGEPSPGYRIAKVLVVPSRIRIEGPEAEMSGVAFLETIPVKLDGEKGSFSREVKIGALRRNIRLVDKDTVMVTVVIEKKRGG